MDTVYIHDIMKKSGRLPKSRYKSKQRVAYFVNRSYVNKTLGVE